jgi:mannose/cellobiose epimerase-like protein (N-acyl-D-glucosamine 2-epimerase family)
LHTPLATPANAFEADHAHAPGAPLLDWLKQAALPMWASVGTDRQRGGFFEAIDLQGRAIEAPRRTRVVARQTYVFATAARRGWMPGALEWVDHGLDFLLHKIRLGDGTFAGAVTPDGAPVDPRFDLYEHAFVLFAWAAAARCGTGRTPRQDLPHDALALMRMLRRRWGHPTAGFEESVPRTLPLRSNPHMHLLEAALEWRELSAGAARVAWSALADELAALCIERFVDAETGALRENFDGDWRPMPGAAGRLVEPGHQFEWAWLLMRWAAPDVGRVPDAQRACGRAVAKRLLELGEAHGVDRARGVAVNALDDTLRVTDANAKLWPQTERVKAWHQAVLEAESGCDGGAGSAQRSAAARRHRADAVDGLSRYLLAAPAGLWHEAMQADGSFALQPCRASSLYHLVCAIDTLTAPVAAA